MMAQTHPMQWTNEQVDGIQAQRARLTRDLAEARAEIERLRAALESLTKDPPATLDEPDPDWEIIKKMREIARRALEQGAGK